MSLEAAGLAREVRLLPEEVALLRAKVERQEEALKELQDLSGFELGLRSAGLPLLPVAGSSCQPPSRGAAAEASSDREWSERIQVAIELVWKGEPSRLGGTRSLSRTPSTYW